MDKRKLFYHRQRRETKKRIEAKLRRRNKSTKAQPPHPKRKGSQRPKAIRRTFGHIGGQPQAIPAVVTSVPNMQHTMYFRERSSNQLLAVSVVLGRKWQQSNRFERLSRNVYLTLRSGRNLIPPYEAAA